MDTLDLQHLTPADALRVAGPGARRIGVCNSVGRFIGFEVLDGCDEVVARFNAEGKEVAQLLPEGEDIPPPPRGGFDCVP
jgi:hypothetical protein